MAKKSFVKRILFKVTTTALGLIIVLSSVACTGTASLTAGSSSSEPAVHVWTLRSNEKALLCAYDSNISVTANQTKIDYSDYYGNTVLQINAFQNEYELGQIVLTPTVDINSYNVEIEDLYTEDGVKLAKENFTLYNAKYMGFTNNQGTQGAGYYPDAMLLLDKAVAYNENKIYKGNNQTVWVSLLAPSGQAAGIYTGTFTVIADGESYEVPVEVEVYDFELPVERRLKYVLGAGVDNLAAGELDTTIEKEEEYWEFFNDYGCYPGVVPGFATNVTFSQSSCLNSDGTWGTMLLDYVEEVRKYAKADDCNAYHLPYTTMTPGINYIDNLTGEEKISNANWVEPNVYVYIVRALIEGSFNNYTDDGNNVDLDVDLLAKAGSYLVYFDEFDSSTSGKDLTAVASLKTLQWLNYRIWKLYVDKWGGGNVDNLTDQEIEVLTSMINIKHHCIGISTKLFTGGNSYILSTSFTMKAAAFDTDSDFTMNLTLLDKAYAPAGHEDDLYDDGYPKYTEGTYSVFITALGNYGASTKRSEFINYAEFCLKLGNNVYSDYIEDIIDPELWFYTAENHTYVSLHMDVPLLSQRVMGWMAADYSVVGNLYWSGGLMRKYTGESMGSTTTIEYIQDYFDNPMRYPGTYGEAFLVYPGRKYGTGPIPSIRLYSVRDGNEESELLYLLQDFYKGRAAVKGETWSIDGWHSVIHQASDLIYSGVQLVNKDALASDGMQQARDILARLLVMADNTGAIIEKYDYESGKMDVIFSAPSGVELKVNGETSTLDVIGNADGIVTYAYRVSLNEVPSELTFSATKDGKTYSVTFGVLSLEKTIDLGSENFTASVKPDKAGKSTFAVGDISTETGNGQNGSFDGELIVGTTFKQFEYLTGFDTSTITALKQNWNVSISRTSFTTAPTEDGMTIQFTVSAPDDITLKFGGIELSKTDENHNATSGNYTYKVVYNRTYGDALPELEVIKDGSVVDTASVEDKTSTLSYALNVDISKAKIQGIYSELSIRIYTDKVIEVSIAGINRSGSVNTASDTFDLEVGWNEVHVELSEIGCSGKSAYVNGLRVIVNETLDGSSVVGTTLKVGRCYFLN